MKAASPRQRKTTVYCGKLCSRFFCADGNIKADFFLCYKALPILGASKESL